MTSPQRRNRVRWEIRLFMIGFSGSRSLLFVWLSLSIAALAQSPKSSFILQDGTPIKLVLKQTVSSATAHVDDSVSFEVVEDVKVNDVVVIPHGTMAMATVTEAQEKRRMGRAGKLDVNVDWVRLIDGEKAPLRAVRAVSGGGHVGAMTGAMVATGIVFFPAAPLFLFMHGKDITIPEGTQITAFINGDLTLDPIKFRAEPTATTTGMTSAIAGTTKATIVSDPAGADIYIDQRFVGSAPATVDLASGDHEIAVKRVGYVEWARKITAMGGSVNINAQLAPVPAH